MESMQTYNTQHVYVGLMRIWGVYRLDGIFIPMIFMAILQPCLSSRYSHAYIKMLLKNEEKECINMFKRIRENSPKLK